MNDQTTTVREARQALFMIDSLEADLLRKEFFDVKEQDAPLSQKQAREFRLVMQASKLSIHDTFNSEISSDKLRRNSTVIHVEDGCEVAYRVILDDGSQVKIEDDFGNTLTVKKSELRFPGRKGLFT